MRSFWRLYLRLMGWNVALEFPYHSVKKYILIVGPHTSNWDFIIGLAYRSLLGLTRTRFLGKRELFKPPFGMFFRALGGIPVDRKNKHHLVDEVAGFFRQQDEFSIAISPEGTRSRVDKLRTGFYFIARQAHVPIVMVGFDWKNRTVLFAAPFVPDDQAKDFANIFRFYRTIEGRYPEKGMMALQ